MESSFFFLSAGLWWMERLFKMAQHYIQVFMLNSLVKQDHSSVASCCWNKTTNTNNMSTDVMKAGVNIGLQNHWIYQLLAYHQPPLQTRSSYAKSEPSSPFSLTCGIFKVDSLTVNAIISSLFQFPFNSPNALSITTRVELWSVLNFFCIGVKCPLSL